MFARHPLASYFILAFVGTWLVMLPLVLAQGQYSLKLLAFTVPDGLDFLIVQLSAYTGPLLAAILVTAATDGPGGLRRLRQRLGRWRVGIRWYVVALFAPLAVWLAGYSVVSGGAPLQALASDWSLLATTFLPFVVVGLLLPSLGEEPGWRGFALPRLQQRHGPVLASLILGVLHGLWHLPAFFTAALGPFTFPQFVTFSLTAIAATVLYTWVYNNTQGSILLAMLLHASSNAASGLMNRLVPAGAPIADWLRAVSDGGWINVIAFGTVAVLLIAVTRGRLSYAPDHAGPPSPAPRVVAIPPARP